MNVVTISYTPLDASGGVPRFNRDINRTFAGHMDFTCQHYSWWDICQAQMWDPNSQDALEWDKAQVLNSWLRWTKKVTRETVIIADSFWAGGLEDLPFCISHQHGNWSHTTYDDVKAGIEPEFPVHAKMQENFRRKYVKAGRKLTTVSDFISYQMSMQWGFESQVINNGIDLKSFAPRPKRTNGRPLIIHFVTNSNKGYDHIAAVKKRVDADVMLLDEAAAQFMQPKYEVLARADLVVHPSAHEGNSYAVLETLACGVPIVTYDVGLMHQARKHHAEIGYIIPRIDRSPDETADTVIRALEDKDRKNLDPRGWVSQFSIEKFQESWRSYVDDLIQGR